MSLPPRLEAALNVLAEALGDRDFVLVLNHLHRDAENGWGLVIRTREGQTRYVTYGLLGLAADRTLELVRRDREDIRDDDEDDLDEPEPGTPP